MFEFWNEVVLPFLSSPRILKFAGAVSAAALLLIAAATVLLLRFALTADEDFFLRLRQKEEEPIRLNALFFLRNLFGVLLLVAGILMLFLPGQGILTILLSFFFLEFPGRHKLVKRFLDNDRTQTTLNGVRKKLGKKPFRFQKPL